jgi:hypothetical protein
LGTEAFHHLGVRQTVSQALALRIMDDRSCLEEDCGEIRARKNQHEISFDRAVKPAPLAGVHVDHDLAHQEFSEALAGDRIAKDQVDRSGNGERYGTGIPIRDPAGRCEQTIDGGTERAPAHVGFRVRRHQNQRQLQGGEVHQREQDRRKDEAPNQ